MPENLLFTPSIVIQLDYGFDPMMLMSPDVGGRVLRYIKCQNPYFWRVSYHEQLGTPPRPPNPDSLHNESDTTQRLSGCVIKRGLCGVYEELMWICVEVD